MKKKAKVKKKAPIVVKSVRTLGTDGGPPWMENTMATSPQTKNRYSHREVEELLEQQAKELRKEPNLTDEFEAAKEELARMDETVRNIQNCLSEQLDRQADAKRRVAEKADALVRAAKEATR